MSSVGTKYPLSAPPEAGIEHLRRLGLGTELSTEPDDEEIATFGEIAVSAHAPLYDGDIRLNIAATDSEFRRKSMDMILGYIDRVRPLPALKKINVHPAPKRWLHENQEQGRKGDYDLMIESIRQIAAHCAKTGLELVLENNTFRWEGIDDSVLPHEVDWDKQTVSFGSAPEEWIKICEDADRSNVGLCLDTSHSCTYAQSVSDHSQRLDLIMAFLAKPDLIKHVHWNDNYLYDLRGRNDSHAVLGKGSLPTEFHQAIKGLDATLIIEHFYSIKELEEELEYITQL